MIISELMIWLIAAAAGGFTYVRRRRARLYRDLERHLAHITASPVPELGGIALRQTPSFDDRIAIAPDLLPIATFATIKTEAERLAAPERSFVPAHKKGGTVAYETLIDSSPAIVALYHSKGFIDFISRVVGVRVQPTPIYDQSSLSILSYDKPGDHIGWHYDHNFYWGRHFTMLIAITNMGKAADGLSHAELRARAAGREINLRTPPNAAVVFEGARVRHRVTPIQAGERRLVLSMTYCTDPRSWWWQGMSRRVKDTAFYGVRALWT